jgi:flagellar capping protein FliD
MDAVVAMFTGEGASGVRGSGAIGVIGDMGVTARLDAALNRHVNGFGTGRGLLEQRAGRAGTPSDVNNTIHHRIAEQDRRIETMMRFLERRESQLFAQFSRMEQAMMQANSQMDFLDQFIWGGM